MCINTRHVDEKTRKQLTGGDPKRRKGGCLGDLVITNHHSAQLDAHRWSILSVLSRGKVCSADHVDIWEARLRKG